MPEDVGARVVSRLGEPAARELLDVLERSDADRAALIGRLHGLRASTTLTHVLPQPPNGQGYQPLSGAKSSSS
jgi:hypothetical protein